VEIIFGADSILVQPGWRRKKSDDLGAASGGRETGGKNSDMPPFTA
jgi:hypothetical protein